MDMNRNESFFTQSANLIANRCPVERPSFLGWLRYWAKDWWPVIALGALLVAIGCLLRADLIAVDSSYRFISFMALGSLSVIVGYMVAGRRR